MQAGVEYNYFGNINVKGIHTVGVEPQTSTTYNYNYNFQTQQVLGTLRLFTTAYEQYALQGFELDVLDYLLKPISYDRFLKAAWKARDYFASREEKTDAVIPYMFAKSNGKLEKICFDEILFVEGMENYAAVHLENKKLIIHTTIKALLEKLPKGKFIQTHKSYIAAINKVESIDGNILYIQKHQVPVSKYLREEVLGVIVK